MSKEAEKYYKEIHTADYYATIESGNKRKLPFEYWLKIMQSYADHHHKEQMKSIMPSDEMEDAINMLDNMLYWDSTPDNYITTIKWLKQELLKEIE